MAMRTKGGNPTSEARKKTGTNRKYPIFDQKSCLAAVKLRHHGKGISASAVLSKASAWAGKNGNVA